MPDESTKPTIAYHGTKMLSAVLTQGLRVQPWPGWGCPFGHICLTDLPEIAAMIVWGPDSGIVAVDLAELALPIEGFVGHEMRLHQDVSADVLSVYSEPVVGSLAEHVDPFYGNPRKQHPTCLRLIDAARAEGWLGPVGSGPPAIPRPIGP